MIFTDYYRFSKVGEKSLLRMDCIASTASYEPFENLKGRSAHPFIYCGVNTHTEAGRNGKADLAISHSKHISSIYAPSIKVPFAIGDVHDTADALVFFVGGLNITDGHPNTNDTLDVYVARGYGKQKNALLQMVADGELADEMKALRDRAERYV